MSNIKRVSIYIVLVISLLVSLYYGFQKQGFHEDEYYTYYSSNRSIGLYEPDRQWQERQTILDEFAVKEGEKFSTLVLLFVPALLQPQGKKAIQDYCAEILEKTTFADAGVEDIEDYEKLYDK